MDITSPQKLENFFSLAGRGPRLSRIVGRRARPDADSLPLRLAPASRFVYSVELLGAAGAASEQSPGGFVGWLSFEQLVELAGGDEALVCRLSADYEAAAADASPASKGWLVDRFVAVKRADRLALDADGGLRVVLEPMFLVRWVGSVGCGGTWEYASDIRSLDSGGFDRCSREFFAQWRPPAEADFNANRALLGCSATEPGGVGGAPAFVRPLLAARYRPLVPASTAARALPTVGALASAAAAAVPAMSSASVASVQAPGGAAPPAAALGAGGATPGRAVSGSAVGGSAQGDPEQRQQQQVFDAGHYAALRDSTDYDDVLKWAFEVMRRLRGLTYVQVRAVHCSQAVRSADVFIA
jgi:hypothetical protein